MLVTCKTARDMWDRLTSIYEQFSEKSLFLLMQRFFIYEYPAGDFIAKHVAQIESMAISLGGLGEKISEHQIFSRIVCSLPTAYRSVLSAWKNMPATQKTRKTLVLCLFAEESMLKLQENANPDRALFTSSSEKMRSKPRHNTSNRLRSVHDAMVAESWAIGLGNVHIPTRQEY